MDVNYDFICVYTQNQGREFAKKVLSKMSHVTIQYNCCNITTDNIINYISKKR